MYDLEINLEMVVLSCVSYPWARVIKDAFEENFACHCSAFYSRSNIAWFSCTVMLIAGPTLQIETSSSHPLLISYAWETIWSILNIQIEYFKVSFSFLNFFCHFNPYILGKCFVGISSLQLHSFLPPKGMHMEILLTILNK